ncbi:MULTISPECIES: DUF3784 domain-containing protein [Bacillaceae]|uniref:DUF3784 domain-containing protein n=2 Tax=Bacillales TaxID=1385 RepID=UPI001C7CC44D|nr:DUF3784 domain-containing protein [Bacillus sp. PK3_68]
MVNGAIVHLIILIPFLIFAIFLSKGKGAALIAGYNTMPESKKAQYDEAAMCKFMGKVMYGICFSLLLWAVSEILKSQTLFLIGLVLFSGLIIFAVVYSNTGNRFLKKGDERAK